MPNKLKAYTEALEAQHLKRMLKPVPQNALSFSSNDYLGLSESTVLKKAYQAGFERYPVGSTGSALVSGYHAPHQALESAFASALGVDTALLFPSGYAANLSLMMLLAKLEIHALIDKQVHASIYDGLRLSGGSYTRFINAPKHIPQDAVLITESIFSMRGKKPDLVALAKHCPLIVDEAHAFGILGPKGLGSVAAHQLTQHEVPLRMLPFGKAMGATGAIVAGNKCWIEALIQTARPLIYSTAMSPAIAFGLLHAFELLQAAKDARSQLDANIQCFRAHIENSSLTWQDSETPIQQLKLGSPKLAKAYAKALEKQNIYCVPMREPTVKRADTGLRIVLTASHTFNQIQTLFECLHQCHHSI